MTAASAAAQFAAPVRVSLHLSCGCTYRPSAPMPNRDAAAHPGTVTICDTHDEWAVVVRVTTRLVDTPEVLTGLLRAAGVDQVSAEAIASEQATTPATRAGAR